MRKVLIVTIVSILALALMSSIAGCKGAEGVSQEEYTKVKEELTATQAKLKDVEGELSTTKSKLKDAEKKLNTTRSELKEAKEKLKATESELKDVRNELTAAKSELSSAKEKMSSAQAELETARNKIKALEVELSTTKSKLNEKIASLQKQIEEKDKRIANLESQITELQGQLGEKDKTIEALKKEKASLEAKVKELEERPAISKFIEAKVTRVIDGDTIEVNIAGKLYRVRYIGIDTPELNDPRPKIRNLAEAARQKNEELVGKRIVLLEKDVSETDRYGRLLRYVWINDVLVNAELVKLGYAQVATYPPDVKYQNLFLKLQKEAREAKRGLWSIGEESPFAGKVVIKLVDLKREVVIIANKGNSPVNMEGWLLVSVKGNQIFTFPKVTLETNSTLTVTSGPHAKHNPPSILAWTTKYIWNNEGDPAELYDAEGNLVSRYP